MPSTNCPTNRRTEGIKDQGKYVTISERDSEGALTVKVETWNTDMNPTGMGDGTTSSN